jgi:mannose-6-phosphate isomerase-like protein (cupin superfamily)
MEVAMSDDRMELKKLNQETFAAEARENIGDVRWDEFLRKVLADDNEDKFRLRRSRPDTPNEDREEMIENIRKAEPRERNVFHNEVQVWCNETLGVVTCPVAMDINGQLRRYENIKVFKKKDGRWQCVYWQVTEALGQRIHYIPGLFTTKEQAMADIIKEGFWPYSVAADSCRYYEPHSHKTDEMLYLTKGTLDFWDIDAKEPFNKNPIKVRLGDKLIIPAHTRHTVQAGEDGAEYIMGLREFVGLKELEF